MNVARILILSVIIVSVSGCVPKRTSETNTVDQESGIQKRTLLVAGQEVVARIADTPELQAVGLGGTLSLSDNEGMLFEFSGYRRRAFWMKNMVIPIDIVWIKDGEVIGIEEKVPFEAPETPDHDLPLYWSPMPVDTVLELNSGFSERYGLDIGDMIEYR